MTETTDVYTEVRTGPRPLGSPVSIGPENGLQKTQVAGEAGAQPSSEAQTGQVSGKETDIGKK